MKRRGSLLFFGKITYLFLACILAFNSCSDKEDDSVIPPLVPDNTIYALKLKSSDKLEFKEINTGKAPQDIAEKESIYFGKRIQLACPNELQFNNDSLFMVKASHITEKYKIKWENENLFIHNTNLNTWTYCGKKDKEKRFLLNIGFYIKKSINEQRTYTIIGQEYDLTSYSKLMDKNNEDEHLSIVWLKVNYVFE